MRFVAIFIDMKIEVKLNRRQTLKAMGLIGAGILVSPVSGLALNEQMMQRIIPSGNEKLPVIGLGSWQQFDVGDSKAERDPLKDVLIALKEKGGKVVDASPMYGRAEKVIGDLSTEAGLNEELFLATKVWTSGKQQGIDQMNDSLIKMGRKQIDLMQIHNLLDWQTHLKTLRQWKEEGKIRYIGITHYTDAAHSKLEQIIKSEKLDFVQFNYSIRSRNAEVSLLNTAREKGVAVIINEPFDQGALFRAVKGKELPSWAGAFDIHSWAQFFLKYLIGNPAVTCVIPGTSDVKHLVDNAGAGYGKIPDEAARKKMVSWLEQM